MTPLIRLLESSDDELELALLQSARDDAPDQAGLHATALALGLTATTAKVLADSLAASQAVGHSVASTHAASAGAALGGSGASAAASIGSASVASVAKFLAAGALVSFGAMTTIDRAFFAPEPARSSSTAAPRAAAPAAPGAPLTPDRAAPGALPDAPADLDPIREAPVEASSPKPTHLKREETPGLRGATAPLPPAAPAVEPSPLPDATASAAPPSNASLAAEIRLLDRTRAALGAGNAASARSLLRAYDDSRPSAVLRHEANLLRVRLLLAEGDRSGAASLARRIIAQNPESHHGDSLRSLAAEP